MRSPVRGHSLVILAIFLGLSLGPEILTGQPSSPEGENRVVNPGFEEPSQERLLPRGWSADMGVFARDSTVSRDGRASLRFESTDPDLYRLSSRQIPLEPGRKYRFGAYVKTENIIGSGSGATVALEWQSADGEWLGGSYPPGVRGTQDWTRVESIERIPEDAASVAFLCYVRRGMTGRAWFDDVEVVELRDPAMRSLVTSPAYRGRITDEGPDWIRVRARFHPDLAEEKGDSVWINARFQYPDWTRYVKLPPQRWPVSEPYDLNLPATGLDPGDYSVVLRLEDDSGAVLATDRHPLVRLDGDTRATAIVDEHRRLVVDGEPFFPLGMYWDRVNEEDLRLYADSPFNCLMPYTPPTREEMDLIHSKGLKVVYSMKDFYAGSQWAPGFIKSEEDEEEAVRSCVRRFRDHPALLAWYLNDELPETYLPRLESHYRWVVEEDPGHPAWSVLNQVDDIGHYLRTFDVIGTDPYPIGAESTSLAARWTTETFGQVEGARPLWQVVQAFNSGNYADTRAGDSSARTPTYEEMRSMAWQCVCEGATGIFFYSFQDIKRNPDVSFKTQWSGLEKMAGEIHRMAPILLSADPVPDVKTEPGEVSWLNWTSRMRDGTLYIIAVNNGDGGGRVTFSVDMEVTAVGVPGEDRILPVVEDSFSDRLGELDVRIYKVEGQPW